MSPPSSLGWPMGGQMVLYLIDERKQVSNLHLHQVVEVCIFLMALDEGFGDRKWNKQFLQKTQALRMEKVSACPTDAQAWAQEKTKALRQSREASWWPSRWGEFSHEICQFSGRSFPGVPAVCFNSCWWRWCLGWTSDLCRLCCGSSSSAVLTGVVVFGSKTSRLFFTKRSGCIVLF